MRKSRLSEIALTLNLLAMVLGGAAVFVVLLILGVNGFWSIAACLIATIAIALLFPFNWVMKVVGRILSRWTKV